MIVIERIVKGNEEKRREEMEGIKLSSRKISDGRKATSKRDEKKKTQ